MTGDAGGPEGVRGDRRPRFDGRRALVTGGASGIGLACAVLLADEGADVVTVDRSAAPADVSGRRGIQGHVRADVADEAAVRRAVDEAASLLGGSPDVLVNAAGVYRIGPSLELPVDEWDDVLAINLRGSFLVAREVAARLRREARPGSIVNISSIAGYHGDRIEPAVHYTASKTAVLGLTRQLAVEWGPLGIRVNAVAPGLIDTPMLQMRPELPEGRAYLDARVPLARLGRAEEVAEAIAFLASDGASYVTGAILAVDGGVLST